MKVFELFEKWCELNAQIVSRTTDIVGGHEIPPDYSSLIMATAQLEQKIREWLKRHDGDCDIGDLMQVTQQLLKETKVRTHNTAESATAEKPASQ